MKQSFLADRSACNSFNIQYNTVFKMADVIQKEFLKVPISPSQLHRNFLMVLNCMFLMPENVMN